MKPESRATHLTHEELFGLALPPAGEPEALPAHLSECLRCSRALQDWKSAVAALAEADEEAIARRPASEWRAAQEATLAAVRKAGLPGSRRRTISWALGIAAALLLVALLRPGARAPETPATTAAPDAAAELSPADRADDLLLRDVALLARGEDSGGLWDALEAEPGQGEVPPEERSRL